jgi:hypothetical protein
MHPLESLADAMVRHLVICDVQIQYETRLE